MRFFDTVCRDADNGGAGGGDPAPDDAPSDGKSLYTADEFARTQAEMRKAREEAKGHRLNYQTEKAKAEKLAADLEAERAARQADSAKLAERYTRAEIKAAAVTAGMNDPSDALAMVPMDRIEYGDDGEPKNLADLLTALRESKPYLFRSGDAAPAPRDSTSNPAKPPKPGEPKAKLATEMTDEEYAAAKAALTRRR